MWRGITRLHERSKEVGDATWPASAEAHNTRQPGRR